MKVQRSEKSWLERVNIFIFLLVGTQPCRLSEVVATCESNSFPFKPFGQRQLSTLTLFHTHVLNTSGDITRFISKANEVGFIVLLCFYLFD